MAMQSALQGLMARGGGAVGPAPSPGAIGTPPPANPNAAPHPYDVAGDPAWKGIVDPNDHAFRNFLNGLDPDAREMLRQKLAGKPSPSPSPTPPPLLMPPAESRIPPHGVPGVSPPL